MIVRVDYFDILEHPNVEMGKVVELAQCVSYGELLDEESDERKVVILTLRENKCDGEVTCTKIAYPRGLIIKLTPLIGKD